MQNEFHKFPLILKSLGEDGIFSGYASVYNVEDNHNDIIIGGAFSNSLRKQNYGRDIKLLWQHDTTEPIGVFTKMVEDDIGLYVEGKLLMNVTRAKEAFELMEAGALRGLSIGFTIKDFQIDEETGTRIIYEADLWEVSLVTFPANNEARITSIGKFSSGVSIPEEPQEEIDIELDELDELENSVSTAISSLD